MKPFKIRVFGGKTGMCTVRVEIDPDLEENQEFLLREKLRGAGFKQVNLMPYNRYEKLDCFNPDPSQGYTRKYVKEEYEKYLNDQETEGIVV